MEAVEEGMALAKMESLASAVAAAHIHAVEAFTNGLYICSSGIRGTINQGTVPDKQKAASASWFPCNSVAAALLLP